MCALQQLSGINLINVYGHTLFKKNIIAVEIASLTLSSLIFLCAFICFFLIDRTAVPKLTALGVGRKRLLLVGTILITICLVLIQVDAWLDPKHEIVFV